VRVLLISENRCRENLVPWPIGPGCVASAVRARGHEVAGLDLMFSSHAEEDVRAAVRGFEPDIVGLSIRNIDNQDMHANEFFLPAAGKVVQALRSATSAPIVLGGAGFTIFPLECLDYFDLELGIAGEGEEAFVSLLEALEAGGEPLSRLAGIPGLVQRKDGVRKVGAAVCGFDLSRGPAPDRETFSVSPYNWIPGKSPMFVVSLQSRRGCRMHCIYCSSPTVEGRVVRYREAHAVAVELESLEKEHGIKTAVFADSNFNHPAQYAKELCGRIAEKRLSIRWSCSVNPHWFDADLYPLMREAGCFAVSLGNESGSQPTLTALRKEFTADDVRRSARAIRSQGMQLHCFLLLGGPGETRETVAESVALMDELEPDSVRVTVGIRVFPGCELERIAVEKGIVREGRNLLSPTFYLEPEVAPWLFKWMSETCGSRDGWFI
jgi:radical SAM superfamily enzyme YgiQ (UPF0313 family)